MLEKEGPKRPTRLQGPCSFSLSSGQLFSYRGNGYRSDEARQDRHCDRTDVGSPTFRSSSTVVLLFCLEYWFRSDSSWRDTRSSMHFLKNFSEPLELRGNISRGQYQLSLRTASLSSLSRFWYVFGFLCQLVATMLSSVPSLLRSILVSFLLRYRARRVMRWCCVGYRTGGTHRGVRGVRVKMRRTRFPSTLFESEAWPPRHAVPTAVSFLVGSSMPRHARRASCWMPVGVWRTQITSMTKIQPCSPTALCEYVKNGILGFLWAVDQEARSLGNHARTTDFAGVSHLTWEVRFAQPRPSLLCVCTSGSVSCFVGACDIFVVSPRCE